MNSLFSINSVFTKDVINDLVLNKNNKSFDYAVNKYIRNPQDKTIKTILCELYSLMGDNYRNEYYYVNSLLNKLLDGIYSVNTCTALSQLRVADHIADLVTINGEGIVYEIKSNLDNLERLNDQLSDYYKVFSKVCVLSYEENRKSIEKRLKALGEMGNSVGIYILSEDGKIFSKKTSKKPESYNKNLDSYCMFKILRKKEYENILMNTYGHLPNVKPVFYFKECYKMFEKIPLLEAQSKVLEELKKRNKISKERFDVIPKEIKSIIYFSDKLRNSDNYMFMERKFGG